MDRAIDYLMTSFDDVVLVSIDELDEPAPPYCCEEMAAICSEIDGFFFAAEDAAELDEMRKGDYYIELCRRRNEHECSVKPLPEETKELLAALDEHRPEMADKFREALREDGYEPQMRKVDLRAI